MITSRNILTAKVILIAALVFVFAYFGIDKFIHPSIWVGFIPPYFNGMLGMPIGTWLSIFGVIEIVLALMLIIPNRRIQQVGAILIVLHLIGVLVSLGGWNDVSVRDMGLLLTSLGLFFLL